MGCRSIVWHVHDGRLSNKQHAGTPIAQVFWGDLESR